jgi:bacillithiol system protein YtxJ
MKWLNLSDEDQLVFLNDLSFKKSMVILKHSTRCSISCMAKDRLERKWIFDPEKVPSYYLDVLQSRNISNLVAEKYGVNHASPQVLIIHNGKCIYSASHSEISFENFKDLINN